MVVVVSEQTGNCFRTIKGDHCLVGEPEVLLAFAPERPIFDLPVNRPEQIFATKGE
jgi:hypothetical protein